MCISSLNRETLRLGNVEKVAERCRDNRGTTALPGSIEAIDKSIHRPLHRLIPWLRNERIS